MKNTNKNTGKAKTMMKEMKEKEVDKSAIIEEVISGDIHKQEFDFKKKLEEKRRKSMLSTSDCMDQVNVIVRKIIRILIIFLLLLINLFIRNIKNM